ncbi:MAG: DUF302 domain-containing protein [Candidatus Aramenus sp.]|jgi:uncharacterized protein (DUF302 family)|nr:DUF302 domain-containing protein [Candidatus Aramenus sp.]
MEVFKSKYDFETTIKKLEESILANNMRIVSRVNAQENLRKAGFEIRGNYIFEVFRPDYAFKLFSRNLRAGIEPPLRIYVFEDNDGIYVEYYHPSEILGKWGAEDIGKELDEIFKKIVSIVK